MYTFFCRVLKVFKALSFSLYFCSLLSCQTVTIKPEGGLSRLAKTPDYSEWQSFFFWGLVSENHIDTSSICGEAPIRQIQSQFSFLNGLVSVLTLGIYNPRTAKVWCGRHKR